MFVFSYQYSLFYLVWHLPTEANQHFNMKCVQMSQILF